MQQIALIDLINASTDFSFTFAGRIDYSSGVQQLVSESKTSLQVIPPLQEYASEQRLWHLLPMVNSTGIISNVRVLGCSQLTLSQHYSDECILTGRVLQVSFRSSVVLFTVDLPPGKPLKITLTNPDPRRKADSIWSVTAILEDNRLLIVEAIPLTPVAEAKPEPEPDTTNSVIAARSVDNQIQSPETTPPDPIVETLALPEPVAEPVAEAELELEPYLPDTESSAAKPCATKLVLANPSPPTQKAILSLELETGVEGWELGKTTQRRLGWEWEAVNRTTGKKARVSVTTGQWLVYEYKTNAIPAPTPTDIERLTVRALGAARGIGASCFQVEIGPYKIVLDCGTRPKGSNPLPALEYLKNPNLCLVSHSHQDHIGAVPVFHTEFLAARLISTPGTRDIAHTMLTDCLKVQQNEDSEPFVV